MGNIHSIFIMNVLSLLKKVAPTSCSFFDVAGNIYHWNKFSASVQFCNCIFLIRCFHNIWNHLNGEMKPFNLKNTITEMYTRWKLISIMNIYLSCWIFTCARPFNSSCRGTVRQPTSHCCRQQPTEPRPWGKLGHGESYASYA